MVLIDKAALLNKIATEVHYDSEHSLEMYAKMLSLINDAPEVALTLVDANGNAVECGRQIDADKLKEHYSWWEGGSQEMTLDRAKQIFDTIVDLQQTVEQPQINATENMVEIVRQPVKGYEGQYEVDQFGRVFSVDRTVSVDDNGRVYGKPIKGRQLRQAMHTKGYKVVALTKDGKTTSYFVHRLVAEAFIPNPDNLPFVNHKDEDKTNNFADNLEWCTAQYNSTYGKARQKQSKAIKGRSLTDEHKKKISESLKRRHGERREDGNNDRN